jgi:hypothetical protein
MSNRRVTDRVAPFVEEALDRFGQGEDISWEAVLAPNDQGAMSLVLVFWMPGAVLGSRMVGSAAVQNDPSTITQEATVETVRRFLDEMRTARSTQVSKAASAAPAAPSGLIVPGR